MLPLSARAPGSAGWPSAPPLDPLALTSLLDRDPTRAAAILAAMRPALRAAQAQAHADRANVPIAQITQAWQVLIARFGPLPQPAWQHQADSACASVYDPVYLADLLVEQPQQAQALLDQLSPRQRVAQAVAYAAWLAVYRLPVDLATVLASWEATTWRQTG